MALPYGEYTIGWIAATGSELATAKAMLDQPPHDRLLQIPGDKNVYTLGRIGNHNVVLAALPSGSMGNNPAAHVSANMARSFHNIKLVLLVGVAGGVSSVNARPVEDVRLGDVFVCDPQGAQGSICHYDFGTSLQGGFKCKGHVNKLPITIRTMLKHFQSQAEMQPYQFMTYYQEMLEQHPYMKENYTKPVLDQLFEAEYCPAHVRNDCFSCDSAKLVQRQARRTNEPVVHYGTIGSGSKVIRDAILRDKLWQEEGIRCFEMGAAGVMDYVDCLVIRGIFNYCDSHQNTEWQPYASAMASAFAKEFLLYIPGQAVRQWPQLRITGNVDRSIDQTTESVSHSNSIYPSREAQLAI